MSPLLLALATFVSLALLAGGAAALLGIWNTGLRSRLAALGEPLGGAHTAVPVLTDDTPRNALERLLTALGRRSASSELQAEAPVEQGPRPRKPRPSLRQQLVQAGIRRPNALVMLMGIRIALAAGTLVVGLLFTTVTTPGLLPAMFSFAAALHMLPRFVVARLASSRRLDIKRRLPDAIDLLLLCVEAGLGLNAALGKVAEECRHDTRDPLGEELLLLSKELQVGLARREAFRNLAERTGAEEIRSLAAQLIQSERLGSSIGQALRAQSGTIRMQRRLQAEEAANKTQIKLLFPLILFIFPAVLIVILMPAVLRLIDALAALA